MAFEPSEYSQGYGADYSQLIGEGIKVGGDVAKTAIREGGGKHKRRRKAPRPGAGKPGHSPMWPMVVAAVVIVGGGGYFLLRKPRREVEA